MVIAYCCYLYTVMQLFVLLAPADMAIKTRLFKRHAVLNKSQLWPQATVIYTLDTAYTDKEKRLIQDAMNEMSNVSCVRFVPRREEKAYVHILKGKGCRAVIGYTPWKQKLTLGNGCIWKRRILHELMHVLGFYHEHMRPDRDDYVTILTDNIKSDILANFRKTKKHQVTTLDLPYDYSSVLHYGDRDFAVNREKRTMALVTKNARIGTLKTLSPLDIMKLNRLYDCEDTRNSEDKEGSGEKEEEEDNFIH